MKGVYWRTSLRSSFLFLQQCPACLVGLIWVIFEMSVRGPYSCCFVICYCQDLFKIGHSIFMSLLSSFFSMFVVSVQVVHLYSSMDTSAGSKKKNCELFYRVGPTNIYIYIVIHRQICFVQSELIIVARYTCFQSLWSKPSWLKRPSKPRTLNHEEPVAAK